MINVGEYVRLKTGEIAKITSIREYAELLDGTIDVSLYNTDRDYLVITEKQIKLHSKNLANIIEAGDIIFVTNKENERLVIYAWERKGLKNIIEDISYGEFKITEILTHELCELNCYKIKEK